MAADYYQPTDDEIAAFDEDLRSRAYLDAEMLRLLALNHWPGKNVRVSVPGEVDWIDSDPDDYWREWQKQKPAAGPPAAPQAASRPATPQPPAAHPNPAIEQARRDFQDVYGGHQGVKVITAHDGYDHSGRVLDAHLNARGGGGDGLDEQARAEIAKLPKYGEAGYVDSKRRLAQIRQAAARRAAAAQQGTQGAPGQAERAAERSAVAGFEGVETGTWSQVRRNAGNALLSEANRAAAKRYGQQ